MSKIESTSIYTQATANYNKTAQVINKVSQSISNEPKDIVSLGQKNTSYVDSINGSKPIDSNNSTDIKSAAILRQGDDLTAVAAIKTQTPFLGFLKNTIATKFNALRKAERASTAAVHNDDNMIEVMAAVNEASIALEQVVAVRDKFVSAYMEIMKTSI
jgi:flagellar hook-basal body complex protein FliE